MAVQQEEPLRKTAKHHYELLSFYVFCLVLQRHLVQDDRLAERRCE